VGEVKGDWTRDNQLAKLLREGNAYESLTMERVTEIPQTGRHPIPRYPFLATYIHILNECLMDEKFTAILGVNGSKLLA
jgi:hypothetical protein